MARRTSELGLAARGAAAVTALMASVVGFYCAVEYGAGQVADATYGSTAARNYLEGYGYTNARLEAVDHGLVGFGECRGRDYVEYEFEATDPNGIRTGVDICKPIFGSPILVREP